MIAWSDLAGWVATVPAGVWVAAMVANLVLTAVTWSTARRRVRRAGQRLADPSLAGQCRVKDTALTLASLVPAGLFCAPCDAGRSSWGSTCRRSSAKRPASGSVTGVTRRDG